jgi:hypothetical protein
MLLLLLMTMLPLQIFAKVEPAETAGNHLPSKVAEIRAAAMLVDLTSNVLYAHTSVK